MKKLQEKLLDIMIAFSENHIMMSIRNGMMMTIPFTIIGSLFLIIGSFPIAALQAVVAPYQHFIDVGYTFTFGLVATIATIGVSYNLARLKKVTNHLNTAVIALIAFMILQITPINPEDLTEGYFLSTDNFGVTGIFTGIVIGILVPLVITFFERHKIVIKLPAGVPPYVSDSFTALIPATVVILTAWIVRVFLGFDVNGIVAFLLSPLVTGMSTLPGILLLMFVVLVLWTCGLNGDSILTGLYTPVMLMLLGENAANFRAGLPPQNIIADGFFYFGMWMGGTGGTLALVLMMTRSKSKTYKALSKPCLPAGIFCINEPIVFGFPIMFNPVMMIPYIATPLILMSATYFMMDMNIIGKPVVQVPWTTPPLLNAYLVTGGDFKAVIWQLIEIIIAIFIYFPFFKIAEKGKIAEEKQAELAAAQTAE